MQKQELRKQFKAKRNALSENEISLMEKQLLSQFQNLELPEIGYFLDFKPITKFKEPDIHLLSNHILNINPKAQQLTPRVLANNTVFEAIQPQNLNLQLSSLSIPEPIDGIAIDPKLIDLVFLPLLCFDEHGLRVGYGKGMYDRFLEQCQPHVLKIGISLFAPVLLIEDRNIHDVPMNYCITPESIYSF